MIGLRAATADSSVGTESRQSQQIGRGSSTVLLWGTGFPWDSHPEIWLVLVWTCRWLVTVPFMTVNWDECRRPAKGG